MLVSFISLIYAQMVNWFFYWLSNDWIHKRLKPECLQRASFEPLRLLSGRWHFRVPMGLKNWPYLRKIFPSDNSHVERQTNEALAPKKAGYDSFDAYKMMAPSAFKSRSCHSSPNGRRVPRNSVVHFSIGADDKDELATDEIDNTFQVDMFVLGWSILVIRRCVSS